MPIMTQYELKKLRKIAGEAVRRGIEYDDWLDDYVPRLMNRGETHLGATTICSNIWRAACEEDQVVKS